MIVTDQQVRKLLMEHQKIGVIKTAAMMAGMNRKTAAGYIGDGQLPSERKSGHEWRTKPDPFEVYWPEVAAKLQDAPELEAKALFEWLTERYPGMFQAGQVRTLNGGSSRGGCCMARTGRFTSNRTISLGCVCLRTSPA